MKITDNYQRQQIKVAFMSFIMMNGYKSLRDFATKHNLKYFKLHYEIATNESCVGQFTKTENVQMYIDMVDSTKQLVFNDKWEIV